LHPERTFTFSPSPTTLVGGTCTIFVSNFYGKWYFLASKKYREVSEQNNEKRVDLTIIFPHKIP
jgi:hypothetical protein